MWYFSWILGIGLALALGIINVMWLEANYAFGRRDEQQTRASFERARDARAQKRALNG
jgi:cyd operon protein YbgT